MGIRPPAAVIIAAAFAMPAAARADSSGWGIRAGVEAPFTTHTNSPPTGQPRTVSIGDSFQPSVDVILQGPKDTVVFGLEGRINLSSSNNVPGTGTAVGPEVTLNIPVVPIYLRLSLPVRVAPHIGELGLRVAAGMKLTFSSLGVYMEGVGDAPLLGVDVGGRSEDPLGRQTISIGAGLELQF